MTVRMFYVDESHDDNKYCLTAISVRHRDWKSCQDRIRDHRASLKRDHGILIRKEIHATEFVAGRGRLGQRVIGKHQRSRIYAGILSLIASLPGVYIINVCLDVRGRADPEMDAWDRLVNRIERTMRAAEEKEVRKRRDLINQLNGIAEDTCSGVGERLNAFAPRAIIVADQGRELEITRALRKMGVFNPVPSQFGDWGGGVRAQNIAVQRIIEDPVFKLSHQSYLVQLADCAAFALLKREVEPTPNIRRYGIQRMFDQYLTGVCFKAASPRDAHGIVRN